MLTYFKIGLDDEATNLLLDLCVVDGTPPCELLSKMLTRIFIEEADERGVFRSGRKVDVTGPRLN